VRGNRKYLIALSLALAFAVYAEATAPRPVDWSESYSRYHKKPGGAYVLHALLEESFDPGNVHTSDRPIYNTLTENDDLYGASYIIVNNEVDPDEYDVEQLLAYIEDGNIVFIAAGTLGEALSDSLGVSIAEPLIFDNTPGDFLLSDTVEMNLRNRGLRAATDYPIRVGRSGVSWISHYDSTTSVALGSDEHDRTNLLRIDRGEGALYLSSVPMAFTNLNVLSGRNADYAYAALSYLPVGALVWDEYYKAGRSRQSSPLSYVLHEDSLRWAMWLAIAGTALFVLVYGRRRQRAIPIVPPPANTTIAFATTVGRLYFEHGDHAAIARKKISYFHEYLRSRLGLRVTADETDVYRRVAERSGVPEATIRSIFGRIQYMNRRNEFDEHDLKMLNADLESFYSNSKR
jgi:hypothetical protein